jgi:energy-coupling factor transporter transmembrane protein EcfT
MQDIRLRTGVATLLSLVAFFSLQGAVAVLIWWVIFTPGLHLVWKNRLILPSVGIIGFFSIVLELTGNGGFSYFFRMMVVILMGAWLLSVHKQGEFLHLGTWLLGSRSGFELGMVAEMALQNLNALVTDFDRIQVAEQLKGVHFGIGKIVPVGRILIHNTLLRADDTADLLAIRGYVHGGTFRPVFPQKMKDFYAVFFALCTAIIAIIPVSAFFILS